jgi:hypothetical protein
MANMLLMLGQKHTEAFGELVAALRKANRRTSKSRLAVYVLLGCEGMPSRYPVRVTGEVF